MLRNFAAEPMRYLVISFTHVTNYFSLPQAHCCYYHDNLDRLYYTSYSTTTLTLIIVL